MAKRKKRRLSRKQLAALAKGRAAMRKLHNPKRRHRRASRKASLRCRRSRTTHKNPSGIGEILAMTNPKHRRRRRHARRSHRRSHRRSRGLALFRNPGGAVIAAATSGPKEVMKADFIKDVVAISAGFLVPNQVLMRLPAAMINAPWKAYVSKAGIIVGASAIAGKVGGPRARRGVLLGGVLGLTVDLWTDYVSPAIDRALAPKTPGSSSGVQAYYGRQLEAYYGRDSHLAGLGDVATSPAGMFEEGD